MKTRNSLKKSKNREQLRIRKVEMASEEQTCIVCFAETNNILSCTHRVCHRCIRIICWQKNTTFYISCPVCGKDNYLYLL